jgi:Adenylate cyclase, family 3 (some proteins contain HAMP domain)
MLEKSVRRLYEAQKSKAILKSQVGNENRDHLYASNDVALESDFNDGMPTSIDEEYAIQRDIRPYFGKAGINKSVIGAPPDFAMLAHSEGRTIKHYACTLFFDIKGSTRLSLLYDLEKVVAIKNTALKTCIEVIRAFDGHVHRLMGDAVMAFFSSKDALPENVIIDAMNCAVTLKAVIDNTLKAWFKDEGFDIQDFGFRVGCDFGKDEKVIWTNYGYSSVGEVTATGLSVDMASKLQSLSKRNQTMLGQGLLDFIDWPEEFSEIRKSRGEEKKVVEPNITDAYGCLLNYKMRILQYDKFLSFSSLPISFRREISSQVTYQNELSFFCSIDESGATRYNSAAYFLDKHSSLYFFLKVPQCQDVRYPLTVKLKKTNYGKEAEEAEQSGFEYINPLKFYKCDANEVGSDYYFYVRYEETRYRGIHTMECEVRDALNRKLLKDTVGVLIR